MKKHAKKDVETDDIFADIEAILNDESLRQAMVERRGQAFMSFPVDESFAPTEREKKCFQEILRSVFDDPTPTPPSTETV